MQIRGGLLIEPWKAFKFYTDVPREQSIVSYDDLLYVCSVAHQAGATFAENLNKFVAVGSGQGGGGSGGLIPSGEWDIANSTVAGPIIDSPVEMSVTYDATVNANVITNSGFGLYPMGSGFAAYGAEHANYLKNEFSTPKWWTIASAPLSYQIFIIYKDDNINPINDILSPLFLNETFIDATFICGIVGNFSANLFMNILHNVSIGNLVSVVNFDVVASSNNMSFGLNLSTGNLTFDNTTNVINFSVPTTIFDGATNLKLYMGGMVGGPATNNVVSLLFPDQINKPPILMTQQSFTIIPPVGATDGSMWEITSNGTYDNVVLSIKDYVIFFNNLLSLVTISNDADELTSINNSISTLTGQLNNLVTGQLNNQVTVKERAIIRGIIDWVTDTPGSPTQGDTFLTNVNPPGALSPNFLYVYDDSVWIPVDQSPGAIFNVSDTNIQVKYVGGAGTLEKRHLKRLLGTLNFLNPIVDLVLDPSNTDWYITNNVRSSGYITTTTDTFYCALNDYSDYMIDLTDAYASYNCILLNNDSDALFSIEPTTLYFRNITSDDINVQIGATLSPLIPIGKLINTSITIPAKGHLCLNVRSMVKDELYPSYYTLLEYVSGDYISSLSLLASSGTVNPTNNITSFYLEVDSAVAFVVISTVNRIISGQVFDLFYKVTVPNSGIVFRLTNGVTIYNTTISVGLTDKHNVVRFNGSALEVY